ncbi:MAG: LptF/LptG family permease [Bacteroidaceae bacterium]|nr:LptF/LptG family permease [Bacteroidaceae bacterium]
MLHIKKLDIFILKSFCLLFAGTFFICLFIFEMQFLWRYVDDLVGKGLTVDVLAQFFFYASLTLVPASLPLAVLLASLITFGNFGERFELIAMKAAGISLMQIMRPLVVLLVLVCCMSFYFQNVIGPKAQTKLWTLLISMRQKSPELDIPEKAFYDQIEGYNLYVESKDRETGMLYNVMIYNFANGFDNAQIIRADSGKLEMTEDKQHLYLHLYSGEQFENLQSQNMKQQNVPYRREAFSMKHALIEFNANFNMIDEGFMTNQSNSKDMALLQASIDSMTVLVDSLGALNFQNNVKTNFRIHQETQPKDSIKLLEANVSDYNVDSIINAMSPTERQRQLTTMLNSANNQQSDWNMKTLNISQTGYSLRRHMTAWHEKITLSLACLVFFFIGAPLGGIIRKGGLGMPVVISVLIFIFYYIVNNTGYKLARDGNWLAWEGMWLSTAILAPIGAYLTYKSNNDSVALNIDTYKEFFKRFLGMRAERNITRKEVIILDPDYQTLPHALQDLTDKVLAYTGKHNLRRPSNYMKFWMGGQQDIEIDFIYEQLETLIMDMANSRNNYLLLALNNYPVMSPHAHLRPFKKKWLNMVCGIVLPVGLFLFFRSWSFRVRLANDLAQVVKTNQEIITIINTRILTEN